MTALPLGSTTGTTGICAGNGVGATVGVGVGVGKGSGVGVAKTLFTFASATSWVRTRSGKA